MELHVSRIVKKTPHLSPIRTGSASELTLLHLREINSAPRKKLPLVFNRGATGRGQIHDYFSRIRVFKGPLKEILEHKEETML